jgi:hypothetical protein
MANFNVAVSFHFDTDYNVEADSYEEAEQKALELAEEWKPYSSEEGVTYDWYSVDIENVHTDDELDEEDE